jgi:hypothetical protein
VESLAKLLPGLRGLRKDIQDKLTVGRDVFLHLPTHGCPETQDLWKNLRVNNLYCEEFEVVDMINPAKFFEQTMEDLSDSASEDLLTNEDFVCNRLVIIKLAPDVEPGSWIEFVSEHSRRIKQADYEVEDQTRFLCILQGYPSSQDQVFDPNEGKPEQMRLDSYLSINDTQTYSLQLIPSHAPFEQRLAYELSFSLALWDIELFEYLIEHRLETLLSPVEILRHFGESRGWTNREKEASLLEAEGILARTGDKKTFHSSWLALTENTRQINNRLWLGQAQTLIPALDEYRQFIIAKYRKFLHIPFEYTFSGGEKKGVVNDVEDLELGHLFTLAIKNESTRFGGEIKFLRKAREIRNDIAHNKVVPFSKIKSVETILNY